MKRFESALEVMKQHAKADRFMQGVWIDSFGEAGEYRKGCMFGCAMQTSKGAIERFCDKYGMPLWLGQLSEAIFEGLSTEDSKTFPVAVLECLVALPEDFDLESVKHKLAIRRLTRLIRDSNEEQVNSAIQGVILCHERTLEGKDVDWDSARSATHSATYSAVYSATYSAVSSASAAAELAADSAARSTENSHAVGPLGVCAVDAAGEAGSAVYVVRTAAGLAVDLADSTRLSAWKLEESYLLELIGA